MTQGQTIAGELGALLKPTRTLIERVPAHQLGWKPHEKSMTLGRLAMHVAELPHWIVRSFELPEFDFVAAGYTPNVPGDHGQILAMLDTTWPKAMAMLERASDADLAVNWTIRRGDHVIWSMPRGVMARHQMQHLVHHRGQLSVYLRLQDVPIPELFGPTADTRR